MKYSVFTKNKINRICVEVQNNWRQLQLRATINLNENHFLSYWVYSDNVLRLRTEWVYALNFELDDKTSRIRYYAFGRKLILSTFRNENIA